MKTNTNQLKNMTVAMVELAPPVKADKRRNAGEATRERLMAAAELLFADLGYEGASTRALAQAAGVDLAMIVYHFGSKQGLYREILMRRAERLNARRLEELDELLERTGGRPDLAEVVHALVATNIRLRSDPDLGGLPVARLIARQMIDPNELAREMIGDMFDELARRFVAAIHAALPQADDRSVYWSFHFAISVMVQAMANVSRLEELSEGKCDMQDSELVIDRLVRFIVGGVLASVDPKPAGRARATAARKTPAASSKKRASPKPTRG